jgi:hypothetical protein
MGNSLHSVEAKLSGEQRDRVEAGIRQLLSGPVLATPCVRPVSLANTGLGGRPMVIMLQPVQYRECHHLRRLGLSRR